MSLQTVHAKAFRMLKSFSEQLIQPPRYLKHMTRSTENLSVENAHYIDLIIGIEMRGIRPKEKRSIRGTDEVGTNRLYLYHQHPTLCYNRDTKKRSIGEVSRFVW